VLKERIEGGSEDSCKLLWNHMKWMIKFIVWFGGQKDREKCTRTRSVNGESLETN
jgi:hypothetical protein